MTPRWDGIVGWLLGLLGLALLAWSTAHLDNAAPLFGAWLIVAGVTLVRPSRQGDQ